jgi:hypothetical protein
LRLNTFRSVYKKKKFPTFEEKLHIIIFIPKFSSDI